MISSGLTLRSRCRGADPPDPVRVRGFPAPGPSASVAAGSDREDWMGLLAKPDWASKLNAVAIVASLCFVGAIVFGIL